MGGFDRAEALDPTPSGSGESEDREEIPMADRIELEPAGDGELWRLRTPSKDVEGKRLAVKDKDAEGHDLRAIFSLEPAGEDESGEQLFRMQGEDAEGHDLRSFGPEMIRDVEGHIVRYVSLEPTGDEEGGDPVFRMKIDGEDAEGHIMRA
jgi:hypothetical protein